MIFLVHVPFTADSIEGEVGRADYSYYFVMQAYLPVLQALGRVVEIADPLREADAWYRDCAASGEYCVLLCFAPPHRVPTRLECPVVPVFAWEYDSLPDEPWGDRRETDWLRVLAMLGSAITHSQFTARVVRRAIRPDYPVVSVPAPVWDRFAPLAARRRETSGADRSVELDGTLMDSRACDFTEPPQALIAAHPRRRQQLRLDGVVYTAVFCPLDGRKNWEDLVSAFCWAFRDVADCTLVLKLVHHDRDKALEEVLALLRKLPRTPARIVLLHAHLDDAQYARLICATDFAVNSSLGEGQCLPLMEYMSAGVPAIAPAHTAMLDYLDGECGFPVRAHEELYHWPQDMGLILRTRRFRPEWEGLRRAYATSRELRGADPDAYARMAEAASRRLQQHCSQDVAREHLARFFAAHAAAIGYARRDAHAAALAATGNAPCARS